MILDMKKIYSAMIIFCSLFTISCRQTDEAGPSTPSAVASNPSPPPSSSPINVSASATQKTLLAEDSNLQCLRDVCGSESNYLATRAQGPFGKSIPLDVKEFLDSEVKTRLEKMADISAKALSNKFSFLDRELSSFRPGDLSQREYALLLVKTIIPLISTYSPDAIGEHEGVPMILVNKLNPTLTQASPQVFLQAANLFNALARTKPFSESLNIYRTFDKYKSVIIHSRQGTSSWEWHLRKRAEQMTQVQREFGKSVFFDVPTALIEKAAEQDLNAAEKKNFITLMERILIYSTLLEKELEPELQKLTPADVAQVLNIFRWDQKSGTLHNSLKAFQMSDKLVQNLTQKCNEVIVQSIAVAPSEFRLNRAIQLLGGVKVAAKLAAKEYLKDEALTKAVSSIDKIKFQIPKSPENLKQNIVESLDSINTQWERSLEMMASDDSKERKALAIASLTSSLSNPDSAILGDIAEPCNAFQPVLFEDHATSDHSVVLGWQSATFHQIGAGIIAHEIGHIVSSTVDILRTKDNDYWKVRECSKDQHAVLLKEQSSTKNPAQYQEEDWADSFAVTTLNILNKTWPYATNFGCALTSISPESKFVNNSVTDFLAKGRHSTGMYRALQIHVGLGKQLPQSCKAALGETGFQTMAGSCAK